MHCTPNLWKRPGRKRKGELRMLSHALHPDFVGKNMRKEEERATTHGDSCTAPPICGKKQKTGGAADGADCSALPFLELDATSK
jgi:hypothetical protein